MDATFEDEAPLGALEKSVPDEEPRHVVAVGASAGGLEALESLFQHMPEDTGAAFVVLQHLSPDFESHMDELLGRQTRLKIRRVTQGMRLEPDTIYLNPPRQEMFISSKRFLLTDRDVRNGLTLPIDHFLRSLAQDVGSSAVAVILSGTGSDGSRGVRDIHEAGGLVIAQSAESARFDGMPRSAQESGVVDLVMAPHEVPEALVRHFAQSGHPAEASAESGADPAVAEVFRLLRAEHGIDFAHYKPNTVLRRIERRMTMRGIPGWDEYVDELTRSPRELGSLYCDLLIGVTRFFRDKSAFDLLEHQVIPNIVRRHDAEDEIRVWVPGCATGEEAYSIAMLFHEQLESMGRPPSVKIFASDVHRTSLEVAANGCYDPAALTDVSDRRRKRYFLPDGSQLRVTKDLRQLVVFARHNVLADAPFTRMDLISCRNMLIYLRPAAQKKALSLFHFALRTGGVLFLGPSETPGDIADEFEPMDKRWKIYRKRRDIRLPADTRLPLPAPVPPVRTHPVTAWQRGVAESKLLSVYDRLLAQHMPPALLLDENHELLHAFGGSEKLLHMRSGRMSTRLFDLIDESLKPTLAGAFAKVQKDEAPVRYSGVRIQTEDGEQSYSVAIEPFVDSRQHTRHYLLKLEPQGEPRPAEAPVETVDERVMSRDYIQSLEAELRFTKENLQATIEELETSNEELQATNEELVAANEELQSTNEELHSVNEELHTVNVEHQRKIGELTELTDDLDNLLHSTEIGVLFLDHELSIRKFTTRMAEVFRLLPQDVGRNFESFARNLDHPKLMDDVHSVLRSGTPCEREVQDRKERQYLLRILPYISAEAQQGVLITLFDIGSLKRAEANVERLSSIVESSRDAIVGLDLDGTIVAWNRGAEALYGFSGDEVLGKELMVLVPEGRRSEMEQVLTQLQRGEAAGPFETVRCRKDGTDVHVSVTISPTYDPLGRLIGGSDIARDVTRRREAENRMRQAVEQRDQFLAMLSHELRNPLAALMMGSRMLEDPSTDGALQKRANEVVIRQARYMARLLDDLLDVTRMRQDGIEIRREHTDLRSSVQGALDGVQGLARQNDIELEVTLPPDPVPLYADPARMQQVQTNLLANAIKYTPRGKKVHYSIAVENEEAVIRVKDEGLGIPPDLKPRIFEPFVRSSHAPVRKAEGMGLGLALVRSIVEAHHGSVEAHSDGQDRGSEFVVRIPLDQDGNRQRPPARLPRPGPRMRIVLVEDQDDTRELLQRLLERRGYDVTTASDGDTGLAAILAHEPTVAIVDIGLPGMTGHEVARRVRERLASDRVHLIALTGWGQQTDRQEALDAGFDRHLVKPVDMDLLLDVLATARD